MSGERRALMKTKRRFIRRQLTSMFGNIAAMTNVCGAVVSALQPFCPAHCELLLLFTADCWSKIKRNENETKRLRGKMEDYEKQNSLQFVI